MLKSWLRAGGVFFGEAELRVYMSKFLCFPVLLLFLPGKSGNVMEIGMGVDHFGDGLLVTQKIMFGWGMSVMRRPVTEPLHVPEMWMGHERAANVLVVIEEWDEDAIGP